ncbi:MAG: succinylglutamate desuccinylase/aspartoacylase family protein [Gammaproteobacteria bacterium]|nr:succinylglutamate desuccinylase/aspartoacylase family protein [Gammaproteobacteria bacterium]MDH3505897.1 succinylglutamate desuccinylase/aspartoacylase family protein [Gammaproteobacteria bacterium]
MSRVRTKGQPIKVGGLEVGPGERGIVDLPVAGLYTHTQLTMPVHVINGRYAGPTLFLTAAVHGDELNGVEIIKRVLKLSALKRLHGCVLAVPVVNVFGFINRSRYLPDRRDLNRSFPGRETGSIAARLANLLAKEIVAKSNYGIDLHTGAIDRSNLPQIRADLSDPEVLKLAEEFGSPVIINANLRDGSLREFAAEKGIPMLLYEAGEALRLDELSIRAGVRGVSRVMRALRMLPARTSARSRIAPVQSRQTTWVRAPGSGVVQTECRLGERVRSGQLLAKVSDPFGNVEIEVPATASGIVIGRSMSPLAHEGDALFHLARFDDVGDAAQTVDEFHEAHAVADDWG